MSIPPISPMQAVQIGLVAKTAGTAAASAFSNLLRSAADLLGGIASPQESQPAATSPTSGSSDIGVLQGQIGSLLKSFNSTLKELLGGSGIAVPEGGLTVSQTPSGLGIAESHPEKSRIEDLLNGSEGLTDMFRGIIARKQLLQSAAPSAAGNSSQVHVPPEGE